MASMVIITAIDAGYFPGLVALANSVRINAGPGFELHCIVHGSDELFRQVEALGVTAVQPPAWDTVYPTTAKWPEQLPAMYSRLLVPAMYERAIWIDADCVILKPLDELSRLRFPQPLAAVHFDSVNYSLGFHIPNIEPQHQAIRVPFTGLMVFNCKAWRAERITERCTEWMNAGSDYDFRFVVQSVLGLVLRGNYHRLPQKWQAFANRQSLPDDMRILHYVGALPWRDDMRNLDIWNHYHAASAK